MVASQITVEDVLAPSELGDIKAQPAPSIGPSSLSPRLYEQNERLLRASGGGQGRLAAIRKRIRTMGMDYQGDLDTLSVLAQRRTPFSSAKIGFVVFVLGRDGRAGLVCSPSLLPPNAQVAIPLLSTPGHWSLILYDNVPAVYIGPSLANRTMPPSLRRMLLTQCGVPAYLRSYGQHELLNTDCETLTSAPGMDRTQWMALYNEVVPMRSRLPSSRDLCRAVSARADELKDPDARLLFSGSVRAPGTNLVMTLEDGASYAPEPNPDRAWKWRTETGGSMRFAGSGPTEQYLFRKLPARAGLYYEGQKRIPDRDTVVAQWTCDQIDEADTLAAATELGIAFPTNLDLCQAVQRSLSKPRPDSSS